MNLKVGPELFLPEQASLELCRGVCDGCSPPITLQGIAMHAINLGNPSNIRCHFKRLLCYSPF